MTVLTIVLGLGIGVFLLWFGESLVRDSLEQEDVIIYVRKNPKTGRRNSDLRQLRQPGHDDAVLPESVRPRRAA